MRHTIVLIVFLGFCLGGCLVTFTSSPTPASPGDAQQQRLDRQEEDLPTPRMFGIDLPSD
jgi:hypothetical protein